MLFSPTKTSLTILAFLWSRIHTAGAADLRFYNGANCGGAIADICGAWPEGSCCGSLTQLWGSVIVGNLGGCGLADTYGNAFQNGDPCAVNLGISLGCMSVSTSSISGAYWYSRSVCDDSDSLKIRDYTPGLPALNTTECREPDLIGYQENGKSYQLYKNGTKYSALMASEVAKDEGAMGQFIKEHAERIIEDDF